MSVGVGDDALRLRVHGIPAPAEERETRTLLDLLTEKLDGVDRRRGGGWASLKQRLRLKGMACCGATRADRSSPPGAFTIREDVGEERRQEPPQVDVVELREVQAPPEGTTDQGCEVQVPAASGMSLATALAAERQVRPVVPSTPSSIGGGDAAVYGEITGTIIGDGNLTVPGTPSSASLMRLLEESDGGDEERESAGVGCDSMCCVCMERTKGAAFVPCGHTFCRVCSRELRLNRDTCPLCSRPILDILDLF
ncbi:hypothetical protein Nepgr_028714 [Nepenthes gracilis]|uniref:RING-type domain-containing protein n=1 Tax=Nepenthes gracilis TaxID=150966 RepID=A0AAD3TDJ2_NEPGR|nr:hypothetical protein Nepgr_028714 [Nepenthes gracilis]